MLLNYRTCYALLLALSLTITAHAQHADTTLQKPISRFLKCDAVQKTAVPAILLGATVLTWPHKEEIRELRNRYIPTFRYRYDDYLQYAPAATVLLLNAAHVKGRHSPKRAVVSYAFSMGIMGVVVNSIKRTAGVQRPDATSKNSFPSGHTAMAFTNATFLHKEYGEYRHPLYSVMGYTSATATALGRGLNNRHWFPDVLAGAAIGIASTELGYYITEQIFKDRGMNAPLRNNPVPINNKPSFLEMHLGYAISTSNDLSLANSEDLYVKRGFNLGIEGAWFINRNFGIGGEFAFSSFPVSSEKVILDDDLKAISEDLYTQPIGIRYFNIGPYFSYPLPNNWFITAKLNTGVSYGSSGNVILKLNPAAEKEYGRPELPIMQYKPKRAPSWTAGIGIQKRIARNVAIKAYTTYLNSRHGFEILGLNETDGNGNLIYDPIPGGLSRLKFNHLSFGLGLTAFIW